jgi:DNA polymerase (family 10)
MVDHARGLGHAYIGITDHSVSSFQANGLHADRLLEQVAAIRQLQDGIGGDFRVFAGVECDILPSGELDYADEVLDQLDYFVISVHSAFGKDADTMTARVIRAIEHPGSRILAHPTGRLLLRRDAYPIHLDKVIDAAIANDVAIEFNCNPRRMDMDWEWWRKTRDRGLLCSLNADAHNIKGFDYTAAGIGFCRKGLLTADRLVNCGPTDRLVAWFARR